MRAKVTLVLTLFTLILLIPASSADKQTYHSSSTSPFPNTTSPFPNVTASTEAPDPKVSSTSGSNQSAVTTEKKLTKRQDTTPASPSSSSAAVSVSTNTTKGKDPPSSKSSKLVILFTLLAIIGLMLCVGCVHAMSRSGQDSSVRRCLLGVRKRLRTAIGNLEDLMGLRLWPGGKRGGEDNEEEGAEERRGDGQGDGRDDEGEGSGCGAKNEELQKEDSDYSNDCSSVEEDNLRERVLGGREEEDSETIRIEDGEETGSVCEGSQSAVEGQTSADKQGGSEEIALVSSVQEDDKKADLCDVTVL